MLEWRKQGSERGEVRAARCVAAVALMMFVLFPLPVAGAPLHVGTIGDLHSVVYSGEALRDSFHKIGIEIDVTNIASEIVTADQIAAAMDELLLARPDVIVVMLGLTDAKQGDFSEFRTALQDALDSAVDYAEDRTAMTQMLLAGNIPILDDVVVQSRLSEDYHPFLRDEALSRGWQYVDMEARIRHVTRWETRLFADDGERLNSLGYDWMTVTVRNQIMELPFPDFQVIPEPSATSLISLAAMLLLAPSRYRRPR